MFARYWCLLLITPPITLIFGLFLAAVITYIMPVKYESTTVIEMRTQYASLDIPSEIAKLTSSNHLRQVSQDLDLITRWGVPPETSIEILRKSIHVDQIPGTHLVRIRARHGNREDARDIAMAPAIAYDYIQKRLHETAKDATSPEGLTAHGPLDSSGHKSPSIQESPQFARRRTRILFAP